MKGAIGAALVLVALSAASPMAAAEHDRPFWQAIAANDFVPAPPDTAARLAPELVALLASPDPELRDDLAATILTQWIYQKKLLGPAELRTMMAVLVANLKDGIAQPGTDAVVKRSFSALILSVVAARHNETPFLSGDEVNALLDAGLAYFRDEKDVRGFDDRMGWIHTAAHTADMLKFLARSPTLPLSAQSRILDAISAKLRQAPVVFTTGEDERIARAVVSIVRRDDFDRTAFSAWLDTIGGLAAFPQQPYAATLRTMSNARHVLSALWTELSVDARPSPGADAARELLKARLAKLF